MVKRIVFWEPTTSPHKSYFFEAIKQNQPDIDLLVIAQEALPQDRIEMGWILSKPESYAVLINPSDEKILDVVDRDVEDTFHVFSGIRHFECIVKGLKRVREVNGIYSIMSEPRDNRGFRGMLRYFQSVVSEVGIRRTVSVVFAIGANGPPWFRSVFYNSKKIVPFAYFLRAPVIIASKPQDGIPTANISRVRVGYIGRLISLKGVRYLIEALSDFNSCEVELQVVGDGDQYSELKHYAEKLKLKIEFLGVLPISEIDGFLRGIDILVLPSVEKDGWGAVISEALLNGVAVVATRHVGASVLIKDEMIGRVVKERDAKSIVEALNFLTSGEKLSVDARKYRAAWALSHISADAGAKYFLNVLESIRSNRPFPANYYD